jgi:purine-nucleoside phosphorylase
VSAGDALRHEPALDAIRARTDFEPEVGLILGSGLDYLADRVEIAFAASYAELPGLPRATVPGHPGRLVLGVLEGRPVCVFQGRFHFYEGHSMCEAASAVRLLHDLGGRTLLVTNAAGIVNRRLAPGTPMVIADQLNLTWGSPLVGRRPGEVRQMFPDMSEPFDRGLRGLLREASLTAGVPCAEGLYAGVAGPSYETPAEVELLRRAGADAVGMSTVPEVIAARERGLRVAGLACLTNHAAGLSPRPLTHEEVIAAAERARPWMETLAREFLRRMGGGPSPAVDSGRPAMSAAERPP